VTEPFIVDSHVHIGSPGVFFSPLTRASELVTLMDRLGIRCAIGTNHLSIYEGTAAGLAELREVFRQSGGRIMYQAVYDPRRQEECLAVMKQALQWPGFVGVKIHPSFHRTPAEDSGYLPVWQFAADHDLPILTHSWSESETNPAQKYATPERFESFIRQFSGVRLILGHAGGRGSGRDQAVRLVNRYRNVYTDFAGDIFDDRLIESLVRSMPDDRILYGSDYPWLDPRANLPRVYLADLPVAQKKKILADNALNVYKLEKPAC
jgi:uncharacterized protein